MIIIEMNGGLGNQLQQYALYEKFKTLGKEVKLDTSWFEQNPKTAVKRKLELDYFPSVSYEKCRPEEKQSILGKDNFFSRACRKLHLAEGRRYTEHQMYDENLFKLENRVLTGYWACEAYYKDILPALRKKLAFPPSHNSENEKMKKQMEGTNGVSIHLRRGDYLTPENQQMFGGICTEAYYKKAMEYIKKRVEKPHFYVFSDEPDYAKEWIQKEAGQPFSKEVTQPLQREAIHQPQKAAASVASYTVVNINRGKDSFYDIDLMSHCRHHICANSTFSFWGARLNPGADRIAIRPLKQKNGVDWYRPEAMKKLWQGWICIDEEGKIC